MEDKRLVEKIEILTPRKVIELERQRLIESIKDSPDWWESENRSSWSRERFGQTLTERSAKQIYDERNGDISFVNDSIRGYCQICGELFGLDEKFSYLSFSFCDEYSCGIGIHKNCPKLLEM